MMTATAASAATASVATASAATTSNHLGRKLMKGSKQDGPKTGQTSSRPLKLAQNWMKQHDLFDDESFLAGLGGKLMKQNETGPILA